MKTGFTSVVCFRLRVYFRVPPIEFTPALPALRVQASDHQGLQLGAHKEQAGAAVLERETAPKHAVVDRRSDR